MAVSSNRAVHRVGALPGGGAGAVLLEQRVHGERDDALPGGRDGGRVRAAGQEHCVALERERALPVVQRARAAVRDGRGAVRDEQGAVRAGGGGGAATGGRAAREMAEGVQDGGAAQPAEAGRREAEGEGREWEERRGRGCDGHRV